MYRIPNQLQLVFCAYWDHTRFSSFFGCARDKPQFLTSMQSLKFFRLTQVYVWLDHQLFNSGSVSWKRFPQSQQRKNLSVTNAKDSFRVILILTNYVFETIDHVPLNIPDSSHSVQLYPFEDNAAVIQMINKGRSPNIKVRLNNAQSRSGWVVLRDHCILIKTCGAVTNHRTF